jgi:hypothetical protein
MTTEQMFEKGTRQKLRFGSDKGLLMMEDLYDLTPAQLNVIAKRLNKDIKNAEEEDFLQEKSSADTKLKLAFDIVLHILNTKKDEAEKRKDYAVKKAEKERLLALLENKKNEKLASLSEDDIKKAIADLDVD